jgi:hypothetical protein
VDIPINEVVSDDKHICNQISQLKGYVNNKEIEGLLDKKKELDKLTTIEKIKEGYFKMKTYSPFYFAIKNNMQGNIYLLLQKGFDQYSALAESIIHNKYNFFISVLDTIDTKKLKKSTTDEGKNLMHILAEYIDESNVDIELLNEVYSHIVNTLKTDIEAKDDLGRTPLHYALKSQSTIITQKLLSDKTPTQLVKACNEEDNEGLSAYSMLYYKLSQNKMGSSSPLTQFYINIFGASIKELNPFVKFRRNSFPYSFISYVVEDGEKIHPLILLLETIKSPETLKLDIENTDLFQVNKEDGLSLIDWLFKLGRVTYMQHNYFFSHVKKYLGDKLNLKKIEKILGSELRNGVYLNYERMAAYLEHAFDTILKVPEKNHYKNFFNEFAAKIKAKYDFEDDSEKYLDKEVPRLEKEAEKEADKQGKELQCVLDSDQKGEQHCLVAKDEDGTGYYFDVVMKKVDIKNFYYGFDNFYVIQLLKDEVKNVFIVWTRWGRSGTIGQYQRTPFPTLTEAKSEFSKIFKQKSGWAWNGKFLLLFNQQIFASLVNSLIIRSFYIKSLISIT